MGCRNSHVEPDYESHLQQSAARLCGVEPQHFVLQIGFSRGQGLEEVLKLMQGGSGRIIGTETNTQMMIQTSKKLHADIHTGTLEVVPDPPENLTFISNMFDIVFTVNNFYFWDDVNTTLREIYRVLRPSSLFLTCVHKNSIIPKKNEKLTIKNVDITIEQYVELMNDNGFVRVKVEEHRNAISGFKYLIIRAYTRKRK